MRRSLCCLLWSSLIYSSVALAQSTFGTITGTVSDPSGAVIPDARVIVANEAEATAREVTSGSTGVFAVPNLNVGTYRVRITAPGFADYERSGLILSANQVLNADVRLSLVQAGATIEVSAN